MKVSPFELKNGDTWLRWRDQKLAMQPRSAQDLLVEVNDPRQLTRAEQAALYTRVERCNMAIYVSPIRQEDPDLVKALGAQFGLTHLDANWLAEEDGISSIRVQEQGTRKAYIPYTNRPIKWHTDGYYNPPGRIIRAMVLHCVRCAQHGGRNQLMDPELVYLKLRDQNPEHIRALMAPDAMVIPERVDEVDGIRPAQGGPVFSVDAQGHLHMRYTARTRSIAWKQDPITRGAIAALEALLNTPTPQGFELLLQPGMGLLCNNVLHYRSAFTDDPASPRLLYRARYLERVAPLYQTCSFLPKQEKN